MDNNVAIRLTPVEVLPEPHYGSYCTRFVRPYLGGLVYDLLVILQETAHDPVPPSINQLSMYLAHGSRHALLGRAECRTRQGQEGLVQAAVKTKWLVHHTTGAGREVAHTFHVVEQFPVLTHAQVATLSPWLQEQHYLFMSKVDCATIGIDHLFALALTPEQTDPSKKQGKDMPR